jgi:hypothetical protein
VNPNRFPISVALFVFLAAHATGHPAEAKHIPSRDYAATVQQELSKAKSSITVCLYLFTLRPQQHESPVLKLAETLRTAHQAGVRVEVILDQNINFIDEEGPDTDRSEGKNAAAFAFLRTQGIPVYFDDASTYTHSKVVVIDEETVITGSSNWTDAAFARNQETNVLIRSKPLAKEILTDLKRIPRVEPLPNYDDAGVSVPAEFLLNETYFGRMSHGDERAFDIYLYLIREQSRFPDSNPLTLRYPELAESLGLPSKDDYNQRNQINKVLLKLKNRYHLIDYDLTYGGDAQVTLTPLSGDRRVHVPLRYWSQGWDHRLHLPAKSFFLISQYESAGSPLRPRWSAARKTMAQRYHMNAGNISEGITDLRRLNLIEVDYSPNVPQKGYRRASIYIPNTLYDPKELEADFEELKMKHGDEKFARAHTAAKRVYEDCDLSGIKALIDLEDQYGRHRIDAALKIVTKKNPDNPLRTMAYLIGTIKN